LGRFFLCSNYEKWVKTSWCKANIGAQIIPQNLSQTAVTAIARTMTLKTAIAHMTEI
jgi:hypothetical protein